MDINHSKTFCIWPWIGLEINADSTTRPCCSWNSNLTDSEEKEYSVVDSTIEDIRNCDQLQQLRTDLLNGVKNPLCNQCWSQEAVPGRRSLRTDSINQYQHYIKSTEFTSHAEELHTIGIALGNICNLSCRICGPWASSVWTSDELKIMPREQRPGTLEQKMLSAGQWPRKTKTFWSNFEQASSQLKEIKLYGGEPLLIPSQKQILQYLVDSKISSNIHLTYNTNGTIFPEELIPYWMSFKKVSVNVSIDNVDKKFEYERNLATWDNLLCNLEKFNKLQEQHQNIVLGCVTTVSVFNALDLVDIAHWIAQQQFKAGVFWNILHEMKCFCIARVQEPFKVQIEKHLLCAMQQRPSAHDCEIHKVIEFMHNQTGTQDDYDTLTREITRIDKFRQQWLGDSHPELAELLGVPQQKFTENN